MLAKFTVELEFTIEGTIDRGRAASHSAPAEPDQIDIDSILDINTIVLNHGRYGKYRWSPGESLLKGIDRKGTAWREIETAILSALQEQAFVALQESEDS